MSGLEFTDEAAHQLEALYLSPDVVGQRSATLDKLCLNEGETVIDIGCGPGFLCDSMADIVGPSGRVVGVDISADLIERAAGRNLSPQLAYHVGDATRLDGADASFDVAVSTQVIEYVPEVDKAISETFRVIRPGGRAVFVATDWDAVIWHSQAPERMRRVLRAWEAHCAYPRLPRTFSQRLRAAGFTVDGVSVHPILNLHWGDDTYSKGIGRLMYDFVKQRDEIAGPDLTAWADEQPQLSDDGRYFFSTSRFIFQASKPA